jgi:transposase
MPVVNQFDFCSRPQRPLASLDDPMRSTGTACTLNVSLGATTRWFGRNRRLAKDFENLAGTLETFVTLAAIRIAISRLART